MRVFLKKILILFLVLNITFAPVFAVEKVKFYGNINHEFSTKEIPDSVFVRTQEENTLPDGTVIPSNSLLEFEIMQVQKERRWHKSGYILSKLKNYLPDGEEESIDLSDKNIYLAIRKHEPIEGKEAAILTTEIILTQAAGIVGSCFIFFAPVDIAYFFTKGAIRREKHHNWFKAGVYDAYDNSIFWFGLKGKPIELEEDSPVKIQTLTEKKALKLNKQIAKRNEKQAVRDAKKQAKAEIKEEKRQLKLEKLKATNPAKYERKMAKKQLKQEKYEARVAHEKEVQKAILDKRAAKKQQRIERKKLKQQLKQEKKEQKQALKAAKKAAKESAEEAVNELKQDDENAI